MDTPYASSSNDKKTIWIVVILLVLCLCCLVCLIMAAGGLLYLQSRELLPGLPLLPGQPTEVPSFEPTLPSRAPETPSSEPTLPEEPALLVVEPFDPASSDLPTLQNLVIGEWEGSTTPGTSEWRVRVTPDQQVLVLLGWCTTTRSILIQNYEHLQWRLEVDGQPVDVDGLFREEFAREDGVCRSYAGIIRNWPGTEHTIVTIMRLDQQINDGWDDYPAGDYVDIYHVVVR